MDDICKRRGSAKAFIITEQTGALQPCWIAGARLTIRLKHRWKTAPETSGAMQGASLYFQTAVVCPCFWILAASQPQKIWKRRAYRRYHYFTSLIKKGVEEGSFVEVDPELASRMIVSTAMGLFLQSLLDPKGAKWEKVARESTNLLVNSLLKQTTKQKRRLK
jgi:hypothetical protein